MQTWINKQPPHLASALRKQIPPQNKNPSTNYHSPNKMLGEVYQTKKKMCFTCCTNLGWKGFVSQINIRRFQHFKTPWNKKNLTTSRPIQVADAGITLLLLTKTERVIGSKHWELPQSTTLGSTVTMGPMVLAIRIKFPAERKKKSYELGGQWLFRR